MNRITDLERAYVKEVLDTDFRTSGGGIMTARLEKAFADRFDSRFAISFTNGTATMHAVLAAAGIGRGDEVIVPPLTMAATSFAVCHAGATPVFADIDPEMWTIDPDSIRDVLTPNTRAIIPVSIYGLSPDLDPIMEIADEHGLLVLEDDAQCFLGYYRDRIVGSIGHASSFSFQSSKHMTSGEGGMVITDDEELAQRVRRINSLGYGAVGAAAGEGKITKDMIQSPDYERHVSIGWNYRMPELCAAVALGQLERLETIVANRIEVAGLFARAVDGVEWLVPQKTPDGYLHSYWSYVVRLDRDDDISWHDFRRKYLELGGDRYYGAWQLTYLEPAFRDPDPSLNIGDNNHSRTYAKGLCPVAERIQPYLMQFKTNYLDMDYAGRNAEILAETIRHFSG